VYLTVNRLCDKLQSTKRTPNPLRGGDGKPRVSVTRDSRVAKEIGSLAILFLPPDMDKEVPPGRGWSSRTLAPENVPWARTTHLGRGPYSTKALRPRAGVPRQGDGLVIQDRGGGESSRREGLHNLKYIHQYLIT
jgi:hypothetical protein